MISRTVRSTCEISVACTLTNPRCVPNRGNKMNEPLLSVIFRILSIRSSKMLSILFDETMTSLR